MFLCAVISYQKLDTLHMKRTGGVIKEALVIIRRGASVLFSNFWVIPWYPVWPYERFKINCVYIYIILLSTINNWQYYIVIVNNIHYVLYSRLVRLSRSAYGTTRFRLLCSFCSAFERPTYCIKHLFNNRIKISYFSMADDKNKKVCFTLKYFSLFIY